MAKKNQSVRKAKINSFWKNNKTLFIVLGIILVFGILVFYAGSAADTKKEEIKNLPYGDDVIVMEYFHWNKCPHCHKQNEFHKQLYVKYPNLKINEYEISEASTRTKYEEVAAKINGLDPQNFPGTPTSVIGERYNTGYGSDETTGQTLIDMIETEQERIEASWDDATMVRTIDLRAQELNNG